MSSFTAPLEITPVGELWATTRAFTYWIGVEDSGVGFTVPAGFLTDLGSIPRVLWWLLPRDDPRFAQAFVGHDLLCGFPDFPRLTAAAVFLEMLDILARKHGAARWRVWLMFLGVLVWALINPTAPARPIHDREVTP